VHVFIPLFQRHALQAPAALLLCHRQPVQVLVLKRPRHERHLCGEGRKEEGKEGKEEGKEAGEDSDQDVAGENYGVNEGYQQIGGERNINEQEWGEREAKKEGREEEIKEG